jgi:hypothetical protein
MRVGDAFTLGAVIAALLFFAFGWGGLLAGFVVALMVATF